jgi:hypothetical protein
MYKYGAWYDGELIAESDFRQDLIARVKSKVETGEILAGGLFFYTKNGKLSSLRSHTTRSICSFNEAELHHFVYEWLRKELIGYSIVRSEVRPSLDTRMRPDLSFFDKRGSLIAVLEIKKSRSQKAPEKIFKYEKMLKVPCFCIKGVSKLITNLQTIKTEIMMLLK